MPLLLSELWRHAPSLQWAVAAGPVKTAEALLLAPKQCAARSVCPHPGSSRTAAVRSGTCSAGATQTVLCTTRMCKKRALSTPTHGRSRWSSTSNNDRCWACTPTKRSQCNLTACSPRVS